jgi:D-psicose/D-tagatose/L-ribulose 3-epimerase
VISLKNKIGIQYGFWSDSSGDFLPCVPKVAKLGFEVMEISADSLINLTVAQRDAIKNVTAAAGMELSFQTGLSKTQNIASPDAAVRKSGIEFLKQNIQITRDMGGKMLSGVLYGVWQDVPDPAKDRGYYLENSVRSMREVIKFAEDTGIRLNMEILNRFEQYILNTVDQGLEYLRMVDSPNLKLQVDTFHMNIEEDDIGQAIVKAGDKLGYLHASENNRKLPGQGHIPWAKVAGALSQINYQGFIVVESFLKSGSELARLLKIWRNLDDRALEIAAKESLEFLRATFKG